MTQMLLPMAASVSLAHHLHRRPGPLAYWIAGFQYTTDLLLLVLQHNSVSLCKLQAHQTRQNLERYKTLQNIIKHSKRFKNCNLLGTSSDEVLRSGRKKLSWYGELGRACSWNFVFKPFKPTCFCQLLRIKILESEENCMLLHASTFFCVMSSDQCFLSVGFLSHHVDMFALRFICPS